jgi:hypothetical protein
MKNISEFDQNICRRIIHYLDAKTEGKDNLNGILLGLFEKEIQHLTRLVLSNVGYLISIGAIEEIKSGNGKKFYQMAKSLDEINRLIGHATKQHPQN